jgi:peptide methionine sulfoxide reductase msrA/msrB
VKGIRIVLISMGVFMGIWLASAAAMAGQTTGQPTGQPKTATAIFGGGCFWCMEPPFEKLKGVESVVSGYSGGKEVNPIYKDVSAGKTGHIEVVKITYRPAEIGYRELLEVYWRQIDPTDSSGQFVDRGPQYRPVIFFSTDEEKKIAEESKAALEKSKRFGKPITVEIIKAMPFYAAEDYHQDYYKLNPVRYKFYRFNSGRDQFLERHWGQDKEIKPAN